MTRMPPSVEPFAETWTAYRKPVSVDRIQEVGTDNWRIGYPKPTIYREHEAIHILANQVDALLAEIATLRHTSEES